jgi:hypothetical protein
MRSCMTILLLFLSGMALVASGASAAPSASPAQVVIVSANVSFDSSDAASATFTVSLINLTQQSVPIAAGPADPSGKACKITADPTSLPAATQQTVTMTLRGCGPPPSGGFLVTLTANGQPLPQVTVTPAAPVAATPEWKLFWAFPIAVLAAAIILVIAGFHGYGRYRKAENNAGTHETPCHWWWVRTLNLSTGWSLTDSWASNVTVLGAAFSGVFGSSDVLKAVLGTDTDPVLALATVSAAVSTGIVAAAPLVLAVLRRSSGVTPVALLAGASLTVGGAGGELAVITLGAKHLSLGGVQKYMVLALVIGGLILVVYAYRTMLGSLPSKPPSTGKPPVHKPDGMDDEGKEKIAALASDLTTVYLPDVVAQAYGEHVTHTPEPSRRSAVF